MTTHVIIDGYNVIRQVPRFADRERRSLEEGRRALLAEAAAYRRATSHRLTVVFDGVREGSYEESRGRERGVEVVYTPRGTTADETIVRLARDTSRGGVVVVTADRTVARTVERRGAAVVAPAVFEGRLDAAAHGGGGAKAPGGGGAKAPGGIDPSEGRADDEPDGDGPRAPRDKRGNPRRAPKSVRRAAARLKKL